MHVRSIIIPAAGLGTRLLPATKAVPKEMLSVYDRPVLQFAIDEAIDAGAERIIVAIHPDKLAIRDYLMPDEDFIGQLSASGKTTLSAALSAVQVPDTVEVVFAVQSQPLGLGHAVSCCERLVLPGPVGVILPDDVIMGTPCITEMLQDYHSGHMVAAMTVSAPDAHRYGIFRLSGKPDGRSVVVSGMVEKPKSGSEPSLLAAVGRYLLDPNIFATLKGISRGAGGEIQLTDAIAADAAHLTLTAFRFSGTRHDCGTHDGLLAAGIARQAAVKRGRIPAGTMAATGAPEISSIRSAVRVSDGMPGSGHINGHTSSLEGTIS